MSNYSNAARDVKRTLSEFLENSMFDGLAVPGRKFVADAAEANGWQADKAFKEQIERISGMPYKLGPNHTWKRFIANYKYKPRELGKKSVSDDRE